MMVDCYARVSKKKIYLYFIFKTSFLELDWLWSYDKDIRFGCESPSNTCWFLLYVAIHHQNRNSKLESSLFASYSSFILSSIIISSFILFGFGIIFIFFFYRRHHLVFCWMGCEFERMGKWAKIWKKFEL